MFYFFEKNYAIVINLCFSKMLVFVHNLKTNTETATFHRIPTETEARFWKMETETLPD